MGYARGSHRGNGSTAREKVRLEWLPQPQGRMARARDDLLWQDHGREACVAPRSRRQVTRDEVQ